MINAFATRDSDSLQRISSITILGHLQVATELAGKEQLPVGLQADRIGTQPLDKIVRSYGDTPCRNPEQEDGRTLAEQDVHEVPPHPRPRRHSQQCNCVYDELTKLSTQLL